MTKEIKAVIFDQDGLMFDSERISARAWQKAGPEFGIEIGEGFLSLVRGTGVAGAKEIFINYYGAHIDYDTLRAKKQSIFYTDLKEHGLPVKPGLKELLIFLKARGCKTALATSSPKEWSMENLERAGISPYFDEYVCGDMVLNCKPDPEIFLTAAKKLSEKPEDALVLEDSFIGIRAAFAGGFPAIMVPDITPPDDEIRKKTIAVCDSLFGVMALFREENVIKL